MILFDEVTVFLRRQSAISNPFDASVEVAFACDEDDANISIFERLFG